MQIRNLTPFLVGYKLCSIRPPARDMAILVRGRFAIEPSAPLTPLTGPLAQGSLSAELFAPDDDDRTGEPVYPGDFADLKLATDLLVRGHAHPPADTPEGGAFQAGLSCGKWSKVLDFKRPRGDSPLVAPFGPVSSESQARRDKRGKAYGKDYAKRNAPFQSEDFDWTYHQSAPEDQRAKGHLRGDEELALLSLVPGERLVRTALPGLRLRALVEDVNGRIEDRVLSLDTVWIEPDERRLTLTFRGHVPVAQDDLSDIRFLLVATEPLSAPLAPRELYLEELAKMARDPRGLEDLPPDMRAGYDLVRGETPKDRPPPQGDPLSALLDEKLGGLHPTEQSRVRELVEKLRHARAPAGVDLDAALRQALSRLSPARNSAFLPTAPGASPKVAGGAGSALTALVGKLRKARTDAAARGAKPPFGDSVTALLDDPRLAELLPGYRPSGDSAPPVPPGPGANLDGRDLSNEDLEGRDLEGASFVGAILTQANLKGANLKGANLKQAVLFEANLEGADLTSADLTQSNAARARAAAASFQGTVLEQAIFTGADLSGARFDDARGKGASFQDANLARATAPGATFEACLFEAANLEEAKLTGATLTSSHFVRAKPAPSISKAPPSRRRASPRPTSPPRCSPAPTGRPLSPPRHPRRRRPPRRRLRQRALLAFHSARRLVLGRRSPLLPLLPSHPGERRFPRRQPLPRGSREGCHSGASFVSASLYGAILSGTTGQGANFRGANLKRSRRAP
ncbi:MAG: pentapeptide repeat-containing protein [Polyangiaceae bacterium]